MTHPILKAAEDAKRWRELARELRTYAGELNRPESKTTLIQEAERWEQKALAVELTSPR